MTSMEGVSQLAANENEDSKLKLSEKFALVIGNAPNTIHYQIIQVYLLFFYTDFMKINPAFIAGLFLVVRIVDAVAAPFFGAMMDKITTPWGKYTPWFIILGVPFGIFGWLTFTVPDLSSTGKLVYAVVTYTIYSIFSSIITIPGNAAIPTVTKRVDERISIGQLSFLFILVGAVIVQVGTVPIYKALGGGNDAKGFSLFMAVAAVITIVVAIFQWMKVKERYVVETKNEEKKPSVKQMIGATFTNKAAVIVYVFLFGNALSAGIRAGVQIHFYKYFFGNESLMAIMGIVSLIPTLIGVAFSQPIIKRFGLKTTVLAGVFVNLVTCPIMLFIPANQTGLIIHIVITVITCVVGGFGSPAQGAMMPAAIDYTEWKTGLKLNGFMSSFNGFVQTLATALSGAIAAGALSLIGYVPGIEQSSSTLFGLRLIIGVLPALFGALCISVIWFDLTEEKQVQIARDLEARRKEANVDDPILWIEEMHDKKVTI
ncbi:H+-glucitol symporter [Paenibacillus pectinilyticus]|uniref:H+-glucitol symporter n=1 Tax=Paenibacillus pectinilyticus TaxID=512399 RepID=A0A1C0ZVV0_9BACL|nr:glycoside-pentoside-hexuronide (GPH):cation symporter [Paenibacillus pectinilyticus]OCT12236.1 H+-glucitol symporter [Paenibacillus pectinilyticus]